MNVGTLFGKRIRANVAIDLRLRATLTEEFGKFRVVCAVVQVSRNPLNAEEGVRGAAIVGAGGGVKDSVDDILNVVPQVGVRVGMGGPAAAKDFVETGNNGLAIGSYQNGADRYFFCSSY